MTPNFQVPTSKASWLDDWGEMRYEFHPCALGVGILGVGSYLETRHTEYI
jgi:hypothetical protein